MPKKRVFCFFLVLCMLMTLLPGAVFALYSSAGANMGTKTTDSSGSCSWTNLPIGTYILAEVSAPSGYQSNSSAYQVEVSSTPTTYLIDNTKRLEFRFRFKGIE